MSDEQFYTYLWLREDGTPFYVGKGKGNRGFTTREHGRLICPKDTTRIIVQEHPGEDDAFVAEIFLIAYYGRKDLGTGILRNRSDGGDGSSGQIRTEDSRRRFGDAQRKDLTGTRFGRLTVVSFSREHSKPKRPKWLCRCACGNQVVVMAQDLRSGETQSCKCLWRERLNRTHHGCIGRTPWNKGRRSIARS